ncbi:NAD(P)-binding protein [Periconia macrospinosa]|uniref:NAD(P)-binding protein n=1 Tax=Periconia macrospinosa TaxID=97972 RepID=A0A2V1D4V3_9PLEO|nr:NAD(P)-binding protein [Periconia macrospinosa]
MVVVAVAGGTGSVGRTLVDALKESKEHQVIVLGRKIPAGGESGVQVFAVDYSDVAGLTKTLEENNVHTVISAMVMYDAAAAQAEVNLVAAAAKSSCTVRFVASNWGLASPEDESLRIPHNAFREHSIETLRKTDLEWTQVHNSYFLDYFGMPHVETYLSPLVFAIDIANRKAVMPGTTGDEIITFTYTKDMAKFVVAALDLPKWDEVMHCYSDNATLKEVLQIAEEMTGSKFSVTYDPVEKLQRGEVTELPSHKDLYDYFPRPILEGMLAIFGLWTVNGLMELRKEGSLNEKFPDIKTVSVRDILGVWKGK